MIENYPKNLVQRQQSYEKVRFIYKAYNAYLEKDVGIHTGGPNN